MRITELENCDELNARLEQIAQDGVPNYFGEQRFGHNGNNVVKARAWGNDEFRVRDKSKRSFYLSTARSWMFNQVLSQRIEQGKVSQLMLGDCLLAANDSRPMVVTEITPELEQKVASGELAISAPLLGDNELPTKADAQAFELTIVEQEPALVKLVRDNRMRHERRELLLVPEQMTWQFDENTLTLSFSLPSGAFATAVVRELLDAREPEREFSHD